MSIRENERGDKIGRVFIPTQSASLLVLLLGVNSSPLFSALTLTVPPLPSGTSSSNGPASSSSIDCGDIMANGSAPSLPAISGGGSSSKEYNRQLTALNCSVRDWITKHVNDNPLCDLNPIFRDYERHLATIESKYGSGTAAGEEPQPGKQANATTTTPLSSSSSNVTPATPVLFSSKNKDSAAPKKSSVPAGVTFNFGQKVDSSVLSSVKSTGASEAFVPCRYDPKIFSTQILFSAESTDSSPGTFSFTAAKTEAASNSQAAGTHFDK